MYLNQNAHGPEATQRSPIGSFHKNPAWGRARSVCFDVVLQKGLIYAGDWRGVDLYRDRVYSGCGIAPDGVGTPAAPATARIVSTEGKGSCAP